jgi:hypothetical protein
MNVCYIVNTSKVSFHGPAAAPDVLDSPIERVHSSVEYQKQRSMQGR